MDVSAEAPGPVGCLADRWAAVAVHRQRLVRYARSRGARDDADDIAQQAMVNAVQRPGLRLDDPLPYLMKVVVNLCRDSFAQEGRRRFLASHRGLLVRPRDPADELCERAEAWAAVEQLSDLLPADLVRVCYRLANATATWHQIAAERGDSEPQLRSRIRRAYVTVRRQVRQWRQV
jgi:DNA-directed RNA polymerase specialized sigma24 family protein